jgi:iron complex outermembrane receptor protein
MTRLVICRALASTSLLAFASVLSTAGHAQTAGAQAATADARSAAPADEGEIVVTGERNNRLGTDVVQSGSFRNAKVLDVPMTVSVVPGALLKSQQAISVLDAVRNTAGVSTAGVGQVAYNNLTIRGIAVDTTSSYKLDGSLNILSSTAFPLEDKDRVEILKGASALYYGFSPPSGIVNLVMKRPTETLSFYENTFGDSNGGIGEHVDVGDTIGIFGFRVNALSAHTDFGIKDVHGTRYLGSGSFDVKPTDKLTIMADVEYFQNSVVEPAVFIPLFGTTAIPDVKLINPKTNIGGTKWTRNYTHEFNYLGKAIYKFNKDWDISLSYGKSKLLRLRNNPQMQVNNITTSLDPSSPTFGLERVRFSAQNTLYTNYNYAAELNGVIHFEGIRNEVLIGASRSIRYLASSPNVRTPFFAQNFINPVDIPDQRQVAQPRPTPSRIDDQGAYAFDRLSFHHDMIQLLGGVRLSDYFDNGSINSSNKTPYEAKPTSWSGGFVIKPVKWASAYGTYIQGLEENTTATQNTTTPFKTFAPISSTLYEGGLKFQPKKDLLVQLAYFDIKRDGVENERAGPDFATNGGLLTAFADADQEFKGFEASASGYVTKDLAINATYTILSAKYKKFPVAVDGRRVEGTPRSTWSLFAEYSLSWFDPNLKINGGVYHTGSQLLDQASPVVINPYTTFDVGGSYAFNIGDHQIIARVNAQNITNKRYWATVSTDTLAENLPRTIKFSLAYKY